MATLAVVHDAEPAPRRVHDIIAPPGGRSGHRARRPEPKARAKWLTASVRDDPDRVIAAAFDQAKEDADWRVVKAVPFGCGFCGVRSAVRP